MKFTLNWLKDYLETTASLDDICTTLTSIGFELEGIEDPAANLKGFQIARILEANKHPQADRLKVCRVEAADGKIRQIVCGASNAREGLITVLATAGVVIPVSNEALTEGEIRGVKSEGMMCSEQELLLSEESEGIIELPPHTQLTDCLITVLGCDDPVIDIAVMPNRPDALGVYGIARDLAAKGLGRLKPLTLPELTVHPSGSFSVNLQTTACPHFVGYLIDNTENKPSPEWMQKRLRAIGLRPISVLVDITNYIMMTFARPLHVFDANRLEGQLTVRSALAGESFQGLDGKTYILPLGAPVIVDEKKIVALAGVMGSEDSSCTPQTQRVLVEAAWFDPTEIAASGRSVGIVSDARYRFERGVDPDFTAVGGRLAASFIVEMAGGRVIDRTEAGAAPSLQRTLSYNPQKVKALTNLDIPEDMQKKFLTDLGVECVITDVYTWQCKTPSWRGDVHTSADLVEEIVRLYGVDFIESVPLPRVSVVSTPVLTDEQKRHILVKRILANQGLQETVNWSFIPEKAAVLFGGGDEARSLANPISADLKTMRPSVLPSLLIALQRNVSRGQGDLSLFEVAPVYANTSETGQSLHASGVRYGNKATNLWAGGEKPFDIYDVKANLLTALEELGVSTASIQCTETAPSWYHPQRSGTLQMGPKTILGTFGQIHPKIAQAFDIKGSVVAFELNMSALPALKANRTSARSAFHLHTLHGVYRDFAFIVDEKTPYDALLKAVRKADKTILQDVTLFDIYQGVGIPERKKSLAIQVKLQPQESTLTDQQLEILSQKIIAEVYKATGGVLRG
jgi:phenylalanyl-tRNA synthetase beta chain